MPASLTLPAVDDAQTISLSKGLSGPVPTELLMIHLRHASLFLFARHSFGTRPSFPRSQVRSRAAYVCKCMICSFLAAPPAATAPIRLGQPGVLRVGSSWGKSDERGVLWHEPTSRSRAPAAHLSFCPYFFGFARPALALMPAASTRIHAPCETSSVGIRGRVRVKKI